MAADSSSSGKHSPPPSGAKKALPPISTGNVKLIGIAGLVKGEEFTIALGESATVGRSRDCTICLREVPRARSLEEGDELLERHFNTVSRTHMRVTHVSPNEIEIEDLSSNGLFLDGKRVDGKAVIKDLPDHRHELKLGTHETFCIDWWRLVKKSEIKMVTVRVKGVPAPAEGTEGEEKAEETEEGKD